MLESRSNVHFSPNSRFIFASTLDSTLHLWDYQADKTIKTYTGHVNRKCVANELVDEAISLTCSRRYCIPSALTSTGRFLVTGSEDHKVIIWDLQTREVIDQLEGHKGELLEKALFGLADLLVRQTSLWPWLAILTKACLRQAGWKRLARPCSNLAQLLISVVSQDPTIRIFVDASETSHL